MATYDVAAFQTNTHSLAEVPQELWDLASGNGTILTGILSLAQRFVLELFTVKGSKPFATNRGSSLLTFVRTGLIRNDIDAYTFFQYAVAEVQANLQSDELATDPADERFDSAEILSVTFTPETLVYSIGLNSRAGTQRVLTVPLTTTA